MGTARWFTGQRWIVLTGIVLLLCGYLTAVLAAPYAPDDVYIQSVAVEKLYETPPGDDYSTPGFAPGRENFTSQEEMLEYLRQLQLQSNRMHIRIIGYSQEQRPIPLLIFSKPAHLEPADILKSNKPVIWLQGQQHGNEPAGGEAMLVMAGKLALEDWGTAVLDKVTVLMVPRCNPDGAYYFQRDTARRMDVNRDHIKLELPETVALHQAFNQYRPDLVLDHHEYAPAGSFNNMDGKEMLKFHDILLLSATNANVPRAITMLADGPYLGSATAALAGKNLTHHWYYTVAGSHSDKQLNMGGTDAIIGRNALGLQPALSFLVESRGIGLGRQNFARRVTGHVVVATAMLTIAAQNPVTLKQVVARSRDNIIATARKHDSTEPIVILAQGKQIEDYRFPLVDAVTGEVGDTAIKALDVKRLEPILIRERPAAYLLPPTYHDVARTLANSGVTVRILNREMELLVESYQVSENKVATVSFEGHFRNTVKTKVTAAEILFPAGSYLFMMDQPAAGVIAMTLEPEADSSLVRFNMLPLAVGGVIPIYRYRGMGKLDSHVVDMSHTH